MRKDELINENKRLQKKLNEVCEHHLRLTKLLYAKIDEIALLKSRLKSEKQKIKPA